LCVISILRAPSSPRAASVGSSFVGDAHPIDANRARRESSLGVMARSDDGARVVVAAAAAVVGCATLWYVMDRRRRGAAAASSSDVPASASDDAFEREQIRLKIELARLAANGNLGKSPIDGTVASLSAESCGGRTDRYAWTQDESEIHVQFPVAPGVRARDCLVEISAKSINVVVNDDILLEGELTRRVVTDESYWELEDAVAEHSGKVVTVTLKKLRRTYAKFHWASVCIGEPEVDVAAFGDPVVGVNGHHAGDVEAMMEDVRGMRADAQKSIAARN